MQGDNNLVHAPPPVDTPVPSQDQVAQVDSPMGPSWERECLICGKIFTRPQDTNRHLCACLPHSLYCPFQDCSWRGNRFECLKTHWTRKHKNGGKVPRKEQCQIYDVDPLVKQIVGGQLLIEAATDIALSEVGSRVQVLEKVEAWAGDLWGHKERKYHGPVYSM
jgi:hypothetical protein